MSEKILNLTESNLNQTVSSGVTLVDFWAPWCGPCMTQGPIVDRVAEKVGDRAKVAKVNVDEGQQAALQFGVRSIPTLIVFKNGQPVQQFVGVQSEAQLVSAIEKHL